MRKLLAGLFLISTAAASQVQHPEYRGTIAGLPTCNSARDGIYASITNGSSAANDCSTTGTDTVPCYCDGTSWSPMGGGGAADGVGYDEVLDEASGLTKRAQVNFTGAGVTCVDNGGATRTDCTIPGGSGYDTVDDEDTPLAQRSTLNFEGAGVTCADDTDQTTCTIPGGGGGTITVREVDLSPSVSSVDTVEFTEADGFVVTDQTGGVARVANPEVPLSGGRSSATTVRGLDTDPANPAKALVLEGSSDNTSTNDSTILIQNFHNLTIDPISTGSNRGVAFLAQRTYGASTHPLFMMTNTANATTAVPEQEFFGLWGSQYDTTASLQKTRWTLGAYGEGLWGRVLDVDHDYSANGGLQTALLGDSLCFGPTCALATSITADLAEFLINVDFTGEGSDPYIGMPVDSAPPGSCNAGETVYDSTADCLKVCNNAGSYACVGGGGTPPSKCVYVTSPICNGATATQTLIFQPFAASSITEASCVTETNGGSSMDLDLQICDSDGSSNCTGNFGPTCGEVGTSTGNWTGTQSMSDNEWLRLTFTCTTDGHDWASVCFQVE